MNFSENRCAGALIGVLDGKTIFIVFRDLFSKKFDCDKLVSERHSKAGSEDSKLKSEKMNLPPTPTARPV